MGLEGWLTLSSEKISSSYRATIGAAGQVLPAKWVTFAVLIGKRLAFAGVNMPQPLVVLVSSIS